ncbi:hypothetical protein [Glutamicibacter nicotianae]|uniref:Rieske domain-containing protein n=1 Tax=Glutamicibacter nicotianae TaxID=37929 RepID=A0ABQ0RI03_GLUNI|nr:hypothetical protein [Glutamicibacter nicotianae]GEC11422.1 hypothetical protein ANI01nite_06250 [Glutamicibacter nicotianae]
MTETLNEVSSLLDNALVDSPETGELRANRNIFTDKGIFELEMKHIWEGNWVYLAHEPQIPNIGDYYTTNIGRQPIIISRNKQGELNALINESLCE